MGALIAFYQRSRSHGRSGLALTPTAQLAAAAECRDAKNRTVVVSGTDGPDNQRNMRKTGVCLALRRLGVRPNFFFFWLIRVPTVQGDWRILESAGFSTG